MRYLKYSLLLLALVTVPAIYSQAQVSFGVQVGPDYAYGPAYAGPPVCDYGYYPYYPYSCAPYGYWGPQWFAGGVFIGAGPWYHWYYTHPGFYRGFRGGWDHDRGFRGGDFHDRGFRGGDFHGRGFRGDGFRGGAPAFHNGGGFHGGGGFRASNGGGGFHGSGGGAFHGGGGGGFHGGGGGFHGGGGGHGGGGHGGGGHGR